MRTAKRLLLAKKWFQEELCAGRQLKVPPADQAITNTDTTEPRVYLGWQPIWTQAQDTAGPQYAIANDPFSVCPAITVMPGAMPINYVPEKRFDQYRKIMRPKSMGSSLTMTLLFSVYEPGIRLPGFADSLNSGQGVDKRLMLDGTEEGLLTLLDWMDDASELMLREKTIPGTDLVLDEESGIRSLFSENNFIVDRRPIFYGMLVVDYKGHADKGSEHGMKSRIDRLLDDGDLYGESERMAQEAARNPATGGVRRVEGENENEYIAD